MKLVGDGGGVSDRPQIWFESLLDLKLPICRYPRYRWRRLVRWALRRGSVGGQELVFLNLVRGLDRLSVDYVVNDYRHARRHPEDLVCLVGKPHLLARCPPETPLLFGASLYSHPSDDPDLLERHDIRRILVPGEWMRRMCEPAWGDLVHVWPVGIDTEWWRPRPEVEKDIDVLLYDKLRWPHQVAEKRPRVVQAAERLTARGLRVETIVYGAYVEEDYHALLQRSRSMVFLCEHETQGLAYLEALSSGVPVLAWRGTEFWEDVAYYPHKVRFGPVISVPYWDERCGRIVEGFDATLGSITDFFDEVRADAFAPRDYVLDHLTLDRASAAYLEHVRHVQTGLGATQS
ncbi:MAG: glycosyltransferase [Acidobacteriota bacterium]